MAEYAITWSPPADLFPSQELVYRWLHAYIQHRPINGYMPVSYRIRRRSLLRSRHCTYPVADDQTGHKKQGRGHGFRAAAQGELEKRSKGLNSYGRTTDLSQPKIEFRMRSTSDVATIGGGAPGPVKVMVRATIRSWRLQTSSKYDLRRYKSATLSRSSAFSARSSASYARSSIAYTPSNFKIKTSPVPVICS